MNAERILQVLREVNKTFFAPRAMRLDFLKNCPQTIPTLVQWLYEEWHGYDASLTKEKLVHSFNRRLNDDKIPVAFVVLKGAVPVGMISLNDRSDPEFSDFPEESLWMGSLQVIPEERKQGLGEELLKFAGTVAKQLGYREMYFYTSNPVNVGWYLQRGAHIIGERLFRNHKITIFTLTT